jgi:uncharacterized protein YcbX
MVGGVHVERIGFSALKGGRHVARPASMLAADGPVGDRVLCLVDPERDRVLRTVENPSMVQAVAHVEGEVLRVDLPSGTVEGVPEGTGELVTVDYWGRDAEVELLAGPWSQAFSAHLGYDVRLARPTRTGSVVYGGSVTLVSTGSVARLGRELGRPVLSERFRATYLVDTEDLDPHAEDRWVGREVRLGEARVRVRGRVPRCAVVDLDPVSGARDTPVLATLAGYRRYDGEICFGVDAEVTVPGRVSVGDPVVLGRE